MIIVRDKYGNVAVQCHKKRSVMISCMKCIMLRHDACDVKT